MIRKEGKGKGGKMHGFEEELGLEGRQRENVVKINRRSQRVQGVMASGIGGIKPKK